MCSSLSIIYSDHGCSWLQIPPPPYPQQGTPFTKANLLPFILHDHYQCVFQIWERSIQCVFWISTFTTFVPKAIQRETCKIIKFLNLDWSDHHVTFPYQISLHFRNVVREENLKTTQIIKFPNTVIFTFDIEKLINSVHNHDQCVPNLKTICPVPFVLSWSDWQDTIIIPQSFGYGDMFKRYHLHHSCKSLLYIIYIIWLQYNYLNFFDD